jgi:D-alanyl-lipoteichoic acid acyltransferase DltB (MBOAT superfamily)
MLFSSVEFVFGFLPIVLFLYIIVRNHLGRFRALQLLLAASIFFYGWWNPIYVLLIGGSIIFNWVVSRHLHRGNPHRRLFLIVGIGANLLLLGYFKYTNFFIANIDWAFGVGWRFAEIVLPLGISFFTFQKIAFLVDSYTGDTSRYRFQEFALFALFFPQLIAGPIVHHTEMLAQFAKPEAFRVRWLNLSIGLTAFCIGLFKKIVIADSLATVADPVFMAADGGQPLPLFDAWLGALAFFFQIYFDFSGYSDMALGLARMFGVRLPLNFNSPYKARNIIDFWQRWHITLTRFLTDYIYSPLSLKYMRKGVMAGVGPVLLFMIGAVVPLFITFLASGLWHGAGWTFIVWGMFHFVGMAVARGWHDAKMPPLPYVVGWALTMLLVLVSLVFFRATSISAAVTLVDSMFGAGQVYLPRSFLSIMPFLSEFTDIPRFRVEFTEGFAVPGEFAPLKIALPLVAGGGAICLFLPNCAQLMSRYKFTVNRRIPVWQSLLTRRAIAWRPNVAWSAVVGFFFAIATSFMVNFEEAKEFIYFQF